jgi:hypothetical protein
MRSKQRGQTSVEYILLVSVMIFMSVTFFKKVEEHLLTNPDSMINRYLGAYRGSMGGGINASYKTFSIRR